MSSRKNAGRMVKVQRLTKTGEILTQEIHETKWHNRHEVWQKAGWELCRTAEEPAEAKAAPTKKPKATAE